MLRHNVSHIINYNYCYYYHYDSISEGKYLKSCKDMCLYDFVGDCKQGPSWAYLENSISHSNFILVDGIDERKDVLK